MFMDDAKDDLRLFLCPQACKSNQDNAAGKSLIAIDQFAKILIACQQENILIVRLSQYLFICNACRQFDDSLNFMPQS